MIKRFLITLLFLTVFIFISFCLDLSVESTTTFSSGNVPLWLWANNRGLINDEGVVQNVSNLTASQAGTFGDNFEWTILGDLGGRFDRDPDFLVNQAYGSLEWKVFAVKAGIFNYTLGELPLPELSTGSMAVSDNAVPVPEISILSEDYFPFPWTKEVLWLKGGLSHGWMLDDRYTDTPLLHEKWAYAKVKREDLFSVYIGLVHHAFWAGTEETDRTVPATFENFWRVFFNLEGGDDAAAIDQENRAGDHKGIWDAGLDFYFDSFDMHIYKQIFFEDGAVSINFRTPGTVCWGWLWNSEKFLSLKGSVWNSWIQITRAVPTTR